MSDEEVAAVNLKYTELLATRKEVGILALRALYNKQMADYVSYLAVIYFACSVLICLVVVFWSNHMRILLIVPPLICCTMATFFYQRHQLRIALGEKLKSIMLEYQKAEEQKLI